MLAAEQVQICRSNLLTLSKLLAKKILNWNELASHLYGAAMQAEIVSEEINYILSEACNSADLKVIKRLVKAAICQYNALASSP
jgi:hypothetical protein